MMINEHERDPRATNINANCSLKHSAMRFEGIWKQSVFATEPIVLNHDAAVKSHRRNRRVRRAAAGRRRGVRPERGG